MSATLTRTRKSVHPANRTTIYLLAVIASTLFVVTIVLIYIATNLGGNTPIVENSVVMPPSVDELRQEAWEMCFERANSIAREGTRSSFTYAYAQDVYTPFCQDDYARDVLSNETVRGVLNMENNR